MISEIIFKVRDGRLVHRIKGKMLSESGRIYLSFGYSKKLIAEIKSFDGSSWHGKIPNSDFKPKPLPLAFLKATGTDKCWSIVDNHRNIFQLSYLLGANPYEKYDTIPVKQEYVRTLYEHQKEMTDFLLQRHYAIIAGELGTGKTLCAIEVMERSGHTDFWYVAPKCVLKAIERELKRWDCKIKPELMTYNRLVSLMEKWPEGNKAPHGVIFDESARIKTPTSQRSQASKQLADGIRADWGKDGYVILMSGAPSPKSPTDYWHQCEVACPGFIKEGTLGKFKIRLGVFEEKASFSGGVYLEQITWLDDEAKCAKCGQLEDHCNHIPGASEKWHSWTRSINEISNLYKRMNGLVIVKFKKDCLDLPDKIYREVECKASPSTLRAAALIARTSATTIQALTLLRELSDGFQYVNKVIGKEECPLCHGQPYTEQQLTDIENQFETVVVDCPNCGGSGQSDKIERTAQQVACPKEEVLKDVLDEHSDIGRLVVFAGFTGSVDRVVQICLVEGWAVIRVDGRGWKLFSSESVPEKPDFLEIFQEGFDKFPRVVFVGQAGAAGSGLTLTASPTIFYWSNDFDGDHRIQSEDRIHRIGQTRGATIVDVFHLPVDRMILENIKKKRRLQALSLGDVQACLEKAIREERLF